MTGRGRRTPGPVVNLGVPASSAIGLALGSVNGAFNLDIALSALERAGKGRVLVDAARYDAEQRRGGGHARHSDSAVTPATANNTVTVTYKDAALTLRVTPQITAANTVIMQIMVENASPGEARGNNVQIDTQRANTHVQMTTARPLSWAACSSRGRRTARAGRPLLHRLPLLGWLFKNVSDLDDSRELLIFITPRILKG